MNRQLSLAVRERAAFRCEYCRLPQSAFPLPFQIDHVRAEKHGGETVESNLALACTHTDGPHLRGKTAIGRTTVDVLAMNDADQLLEAFC